MYNLKITLQRVLLVCAVLSMSVWAQAQQRNMHKTFDLHDSEEANYTLTKTMDGNFVIAVSDYRPANTIFPGITIMMLDSCLDTISVISHEWANQTDPGDLLVPYDIEELPDGFLIVGKLKEINQSNTHGFALKVDPTGQFMAMRWYENISEVRAAISSFDGSRYILCGHSFLRNGPIVFDIMSNNLTHGMWYHTFSAFESGGTFYDLVRTENEDFVVTGDLYDNQDIDVLTVGMNDMGAFRWIKRLNEPFMDPQNLNLETSRGITFDPIDRTVTICGQTAQGVAGSPLLLVDVLGVDMDETNGNINWDKRYDLGSLWGSGFDMEQGEKIMYGSDGNLHIVGNLLSTFPAGMNLNGFLLDLTASGDPIEVEEYGSGASEGLYQIREHADDDFVMAGTQDSRVYLVAANDAANVPCLDQTYLADTIPVSLQNLIADTVSIDTLSTSITLDEWQEAMTIDTLCDGCDPCEPVQSMATYYHIIDTNITGNLHRFMNEGDFFSEDGKDTLIFAHTLEDRGREILLVKAEEDGTIEWTRHLGTDGREEVYVVRHIEQDGGFIVGGVTHNYNSGQRLPFLSRLNSKGKELWTYTYETTHEIGSMKLIVTAAGDFVGVTNHDVWNDPTETDEPIIFKVLANGTLDKYKILSDGQFRYWDHFTDLMETTTGHIVAVGRGGHRGDYNPGMMAKFDGNLNMQWVKHWQYVNTGTLNIWGGPTDRSQIKFHGVVEYMNHYYVTGTLSNDNGSNAGSTYKNLFFAEITTGGFMNYYRTYGSSTNANVFNGWDIDVTTASGAPEFLIAGNTKVGSEQRSVLVKLDAGGLNPVAHYYGEGKKNMATFVRGDSDGNIMLTGIHSGNTASPNQYQPFYARLNAGGTGDPSSVCYTPLPVYQYDTLDVDSVTITYIDDTAATEVLRDFDGEYFCPPIADCDGSRYKSAFVDVENTPTEVGEARVYPNPFQAETTLEFTLDKRSRVTAEVYDLVTGAHLRTVQPSATLESGHYQRNIDLSQLAVGMYVCVLTIDGERQLIRLVRTH